MHTERVYSSVFSCAILGDVQHGGFGIIVSQGVAQVTVGAVGNNDDVNAGLGDHLLNRIGIGLSRHKDRKLGKLLFQERQLMLGQRCFVIGQEQDGGQLKGLHIVDIVFFGGALKKALLHTRNGAAGHGGKLANIGIGIDGEVDIGLADGTYTQHNDLSLSILKIGIATETSVAMPICSLFYDIIIPQMATFVNSIHTLVCVTKSLARENRHKKSLKMK